MKKKTVCQVTSQPAASLKAIPKLPEVHSQSFTEYKHELDVEKLKKPLTRENYVTKFHHLLCWEEQEHDKILKQRYILYYVTLIIYLSFFILALLLGPLMCTK